MKINSLLFFQHHCSRTTGQSFPVYDNNFFSFSGRTLQCKSILIYGPFFRSVTYRTDFAPTKITAITELATGVDRVKAMPRLTRWQRENRLEMACDLMYGEREVHTLLSPRLNPTFDVVGVLIKPKKNKVETHIQVVNEGVAVDGALSPEGGSREDQANAAAHAGVHDPFLLINPNLIEEQNYTSSHSLDIMEDRNADGLAAQTTRAAVDYCPRHDPAPAPPGLSPLAQARIIVAKCQAMASQIQDGRNGMNPEELLLHTSNIPEINRFGQSVGLKIARYVVNQPVAILVPTGHDSLNAYLRYRPSVQSSSSSVAAQVAVLPANLSPLDIVEPLHNISIYFGYGSFF